jgi:hypothetical protein
MSCIHFAFLEQTSKDQLFHLQDEVIFWTHGDGTKRFKLQFPRAPYFFLVNFELGFSVTASCIVIKLQFILLFINFQIKKRPCLHLLWF